MLENFPIWSQIALLAVQGTLLCALAYAALGLLSRRSAALRHGVLRILFVVALLLPGINLATQQYNPWPTYARSAEPSAGQTAAAPVDESLSPSPSVDLARASAPLGEFLGKVLRYAGAMVGVLWMIGAAVLLSRRLLGFVLLTNRWRKAIHAWARLSARTEELARRVGLRSRVRTRLSADSPTPLACGVLRPKILLPDQAAEWDDPLVDSVLLHELGHVSRRDTLWQAIGSLAVALHWFNPWMWAALRRMAVERESACDAFVLGQGVRPSRYAHHLLQVAWSLDGGSAGAPMPAVGMAAGTSLEKRVRSILRTDARSLRKRAGRLPLALVVLLSVLSSAAAASYAGTWFPLQARVSSTSPQEASETSGYWQDAEISFSDDRSLLHVSASSVRVSSDGMEIVAIKPGGWFEARIEEAAVVRVVRLDPAETDNGLQHVYRVEGQERPWDGEADELLARALDRLQSHKRAERRLRYFRILHRDRLQQMQDSALRTLSESQASMERMKEALQWNAEKLELNLDRLRLPELDVQLRAEQLALAASELSRLHIDADQLDRVGESLELLRLQLPELSEALRVDQLRILKEQQELSFDLDEARAELRTEMLEELENHLRDLDADLSGTDWRAFEERMREAIGRLSQGGRFSVDDSRMHLRIEPREIRERLRALRSEGVREYGRQIDDLIEELSRIFSDFQVERRHD